MEIRSVLIVARTLEELRALDAFGLDLKHRAARREAENRFVVPGVLTGEEVGAVEAAGYRVEVVEDLSGVAEERLRELSPGNRFADARSAGEMAERTVLGYLTVDEVETALVNLQATNPALVTLILLPNPTWEGRRSRAVRIRAGTRAVRPGVLFTGGVHAREWGGSDICVSFATRIVAAYRAGAGLSFGARSYTAAQVRAVMENVDLFVFPDVNPDGKHFSQTTDPGSGSSQGFWWRKNRNPNTSTGSSARGVDVNRNFDFLWSSGIGTSASPSSFVYRGTAAFSEPEARNVRHLWDAYPGIRYYVDIHSFGELILYSWGDDDNQTTVPAQNFRNPAYDGLRGTPGDTGYREFISTLDQNTAVNFAGRMRAALAAVRGRAYTAQQAVGLYPTSATTDDYAFSRHIANPLRGRVYGFTLEFGTEFVPPWAEMRNIVQDVGAALTEFSLCAASDVYARDSALDTGAVPSAGEFWNSPDVWVRNADDGGTAHQDTVRGRDNFVYVRVRNRGAAAAANVKVRAYVATWAGTEFVHPGDWIPRNPAGGGSLGAAGTYLLGEATIPTVAAGSSQVARILWRAALVPPALGWHPCLLVEISPNDGPQEPGAHVWDNNNLAQKNISIVDAARGTLIEFPFLVGSSFSEALAGSLTVRRTTAPEALPVYLDVKDPTILNALPRRLADEEAPDEEAVAAAAEAGAATIAVHEVNWNATLLQPVTVALSAGGAGGGGDVVLSLPADTRIELPSGGSGATGVFGGGGGGAGGRGYGGGGDDDGGDGRATPAFSGLGVVKLGNAKVLKLAARGDGRLPLTFRRREVKPMALKVAVPASAKPGDRYELRVTQHDDRQRVVGGVVLVVNVTK